MNFRFQQPDMLLEARKTGGKGVFLECLIMVGIFFLAELTATFAVMLFTFLFAFVMGFMDHGNMGRINPAIINDITTIASLITQVFTISVTLGLARWFQKRKAWTLGFKKKNWMKEYAIGALAGLIAMTTAWAMAWVSQTMLIRPNFSALTGTSALVLCLYFIGYLFQGMAEEVLCRGLFLISLARKKGNLWMAILVSSLFFAALHLLNPGITVLAFCNLTLFGIFAGVYFLKRGNIWGIGAFHSIWNFAQGNLYGVTVSGALTGPSLFVSVPNAASEIFNGGSFGLEGGLFTTVVLVIGILILMKLPQKDAAELSSPAEPAE